MKRFFKVFKTKTTRTFKRACNAYSRNFMELYGPLIKAGINPFL